MGIRAIQAVWDHSRQDGAHLLVLLALADSADNRTFECWLGMEKLARKTRYSLRWVRQIMHDLIAAGEIAVVPNAGPGRRNLFRLTLSGCEEALACSVDKPVDKMVDNLMGSGRIPQEALHIRGKKSAPDPARSRLPTRRDTSSPSGMPPPGDPEAARTRQTGVQPSPRARKSAVAAWGSVSYPSLDPLKDPSGSHASISRDRSDHQDDPISEHFPRMPGHARKCVCVRCLSLRQPNHAQLAGGIAR